MKPRILEILRECDRLSDECVERCGLGCWTEELTTVLTFDEKREIIANWLTMPGWANFIDAFIAWSGCTHEEIHREAHRLYLASQTARNQRR